MKTLSLKDGTGNPAPLGLLAFGMTTVLLNLHNAGLFGFDTMILSMGIFYGGLAQVIAGAMEWKKNNTFGTTAFISYGMFWLSLAGLLAFGKVGLFPAPGEDAMAAYFCVWGLFTLVMFIGTLRLSRPLQVVFATLTLLFALLAAREIVGKTDAGDIIGLVAGIEGIVCGLSAMFAGLYQVLRELFAPPSRADADEDGKPGYDIPEALSREISDQIKLHLDRKLEADRRFEGDADRNLTALVERASKSAVQRLMPSIIEHVRKGIRG